jgi:hypothetical protein
MAEKDVSGASKSQGSSAPSDNGVSSLRASSNAQTDAYRKVIQERREKRRAELREELLDRGVPEEKIEEEIERVLKKERTAKKNSTQTAEQLLSFRDEYDDEDLKKVGKNRDAILRDSRPVLDELRKQGNGVMVEEFFTFVKPRVFNDLVEGHEQRFAAATDDAQRAKVASDTLESILAEAEHNGSGPTREIRKNLTRSMEAIAQRAPKGEAPPKTVQEVTKKLSKAQTLPTTVSAPPSASVPASVPDEETETVRETREQLRENRLKNKWTALKEDPEAELFVRLVTAGVPFQDPGFERTLGEFQAARPFGEEQKPLDALSLAAIAYLHEEGAQAKDAAWRPFVRKAVETVADSPARDPVYQAIVSGPLDLPPGTPDGLHLPASHAERVQVFALRFPDKARSYAYADQEIAVALQTVERQRTAAPGGTVEIGMTAQAAGGGAATVAAVAAGAAATALGAAFTLEQRQAQLLQSARVLQAGYQAVAERHAQRLEGVRQELQTISQQIAQLESGRATTGTLQGQPATLPRLEERRRELQDEQLEITLRAQENKSGAERFARSVKTFEKAKPTKSRLQEFEGGLRQVPLSVQQAASTGAPAKLSVARGAAPASAKARAGRALAGQAARIGARRSVGRSALAGALFAVTSLIGGQQRSLREKDLEQDAYSQAYRPEAADGGRRSVLELPGRSYTQTEESPDADQLPTETEERQKIRGKERGMRQAVEFQLGSQAFEPSEGDGLEEEGKIEWQQGAEEAPEEAADEGFQTADALEALQEQPQTNLEAGRAQDLLAGQQQTRSARGAAGGGANAAADAAGGFELPGELGGVQRLVRLYNAMKIGSAVTGVGLLVTIGIMNLQMFAKIAGIKAIPKQTLIEDAATIALDIILFVGCIFASPFLVTAAIAAGAVVGSGHLIDVIVSALGF